MKRVIFTLCIAVAVIVTVGFMVKGAFNSVKAISNQTYVIQEY